ncbi:DUF3563 family protein [Aurantimonas sp. Leaf443]|nr:DUF3563 family protein [Aurantimonas sp. Leaf443]
MNLKSLFAGRQRQSRSDRYLSEATSLSDLEMREREIDAGRFRTSPPRLR